MNLSVKTLAVCILLAGTGAVFAQKGETVRIAFIDPL